MKIISFKLTAFLIILGFCDFNAYSKGSDIIHLKDSSRIQYHFGILLSYNHVFKTTINHTSYTYKSYKINSFGISFVNQMSLPYHLFLDLTLDLCYSKSRLEYQSLINTDYKNINFNSVFIIIPIRINYYIPIHKKYRLNFGTGGCFGNDQTVHEKGNSVEFGIYHDIDNNFSLKFRNYFDSSYWNIWVSNCIGLDYLINKKKSLRFQCKIDFFSIKRVMFGLNIGVVI